LTVNRVAVGLVQDRVADGQSIRSSHLRAQSALELAGLGGADLPVLAWSGQADPANTMLVRPPSTEGP